jgi:hypothetical protein
MCKGAVMDISKYNKSLEDKECHHDYSRTQQAYSTTQRYPGQSFHYRSHFFQPSFSKIHLLGQNLVHTPTLSITITKPMSSQVEVTQPINKTIDISRYTIRMLVQFAMDAMYTRALSLISDKIFAIMKVI